MCSQINKPTNQQLNNILQQQFTVLDKGFVRVIDYMGDDAAIVQAARVSYGKGTKTVNDDTALIRYLLKHKHTSPFEMCEIKLHIKCPIFIARQWLRHRTANVNEYSARYSEMPYEYYTPNQQQVQPQSSSNKQGRENHFTEATTNNIINQITQTSENAFAVYKDLLNPLEDNKGLAKEIARTVLPVNFYTEFYWKIDLHNLLHFLFLRSHNHAQYEIREYANCILNIVKIWVPITYQAFLDYTVNSKSFSGNELKILQAIINNNALQSIKPEDYGLSAREYKEFTNKLNINENQ